MASESCVKQSIVVSKDESPTVVLVPDINDNGIIETPSGAAQECWSEREEQNLVRKVDLFLMPTIWLMYLLSYMDRTNIGNAKIAGMADDLNLTSDQYSVTLVVFFVTYTSVVFEAPSNMILVRSRPSIYLPVIMIIWGALTCCMSVVTSYHHLVVLRILVGVFEAGFAPGILLIISSWYKKNEQSTRFAIYISAAILSGAFGGLLAGAITGGLDGRLGLRGWRWLFIVEGAATIAFAACAHFILLDFPATTKKLTERERFIAINRLLDQSKDETRKLESVGKRRSIANAFRDWRTWGFIVGYMVIVGSSTLSYFYPTLVKGLGYKSNVQAQYMTVPIYAVAFVCTAISGWACDKIHQWRGLAISCWLTLSLITSIVVCTVYNYTVRYAMLVLMAAGLWASNALSLSYASSTFADLDAETRAVALAAVNAFGNLAQIYGSYLFPAEDAPKYLMGFGVISGLLGLGIFTYFSLNMFGRAKKHA